MPSLSACVVMMMMMMMTMMMMTACDGVFVCERMSECATWLRVLTCHRQLGPWLAVEVPDLAEKGLIRPEEPGAAASAQ
jgi:hypothetical protein